MSVDAAERDQGLTGVAALNAATNIAARFAGMFVGVVLTPFILHRLGRELYGIVATAGSVLEYLWLLRGGLGTGMRRFVTVHFHAGDRETAARYYAAGFWWSAVLRLLVVASGIGLSHVLCRFVRLEPNLVSDATVGIMLIFVSAGLNDVGGVLEIPIYATGHMVSISAVRVAGSLMRIALVVPAFLLFVPSLTVYAAALCVGEILIATALAVVGARAHTVPSIVPPIDFGTREVRNALFRFSSFQMVSQLASILYLATDNLLIGRIYGPGRVTEYSLGTRWAPMITAFTWAGVSAMMPLLTRMEAQGEHDRSKRVVLKAAAVNSAVAVPLCLVPCVIGDVFLTRWVGPQYRHCVSYMIAMLLPMLVGVTLEPVWVALGARGQIGWIALGDIIVAVLNPILSLVLALKFHLGPLGFALGNTFASLARNLILRPVLNRRDPTMPSVRRTLLTLPAALAGGAPALLLLFFLKPFYSQTLAHVLVAGASGGVLCLAGALLTAVGWADTRRIAESLVSRTRLVLAGATRRP